MDNVTPLTLVLMAGFTALLYLQTFQKRLNVTAEAAQLDVDRQEVTVKRDDTLLEMYRAQIELTRAQNARIERIEIQHAETTKQNMELLKGKHSLEIENTDLRRKVETLEAKVSSQEAKIASQDAKIEALETENADLRKQLDEIRTKVNG